MGCSKDAALVLVTTWLQLNNELVKTFQRQYKQSEYKGTATSEHHGLYFMGRIELMSARYCQLRQYACMERVDAEGYRWNADKISLEEIQENDLEQLASKNEEFLLTVRNAFSQKNEGEENPKNLQIVADAQGKVIEAYNNALAVRRSVRYIISPSGMSSTTQRPRSGSESSGPSEPSPACRLS